MTNYRPGSVEIRDRGTARWTAVLILGIPEEKGVTSGTCLEGFNIAKGEDMAISECLSES